MPWIRSFHFLVGGVGDAWVGDGLWVGECEGGGEEKREEKVGEDLHVLNVFKFVALLLHFQGLELCIPQY